MPVSGIGCMKNLPQKKFIEGERICFSMSKNIRFIIGLFGAVGLAYGAFATFNDESDWFYVWLIMLALWLTGWYISQYIKLHKIGVVRCLNCNFFVISSFKYCIYCRSPME